MAWKFLRRLAKPDLSTARVVVGRIDDVHVSAAGADRNDPHAVAAAHQMEEELRRELDGVHDADEIRERLERYEREHGMQEVSSSSSRFELIPDAKTLAREGPDGVQRLLQELERELEEVDDPAEVRLRMESFARERGWTFREK